MARERAPRAWQRMLSGRRLDLLDPSPLDIEIEDIAHGLARVARWNGQTTGPHIFSVAQHSLLVERIAGEANPTFTAPACLYALLHDAAEYVVGDMISPFKVVLGPSYKGVEIRILGAIMQRFSLPAAPAPKLAKRIKLADQAATFLEATRLAGFGLTEAQKYFGEPGVTSEAIEALLLPLPVEAAQAQFLQRFREIEERCGAG